MAPGEVKYCGGYVMMRVEALQLVGAYRPSLIAGEEPELCVRLRQNGWKIVCLPLAMTLHDAAITRFSQWWRRSVRTGHAFAEGAYLHGAPPERHWVRESRRVWLWGAGVPAVILLSSLLLGPNWLLLALVYPAQVARLYVKRARASEKPLWASIFLVLGNFPEAAGQAWFYVNLLRGRAGQLIEYK